MMKLLWIMLSVVCWTNLACGTTPLHAWSENTSDSVAHSSLKFAWDGYRALGVPTGKNVFYAPYSITNAVGMLILGSGGHLKTQLKAAIRFPPSLTDDQQFHHQLSEENEKLMAETEATIGVGNRIFVNTPLASRLNPRFQTSLEAYYKSGVVATPFSTNPAQAQSAINDFVSEKTHGELNQILLEPPNPTTILSLVNAVYFKGTWTVPFNDEETRSDTFVTRSGNVTAHFMNRKSWSEHASSDELHVQIVALPYTENEKYAFYAIVPDGGHNLESVEANLDDVKIRQLVSRLRSHPVDLKIPRFSLESRFELTDMLKSLGATGVDQPQDGTNSHIFIDSFGGAFIDEIIHQAKVEVNENGTVASGATVISVDRTLFIPIYQPVHLDKPFLFFIADVSNGYVLFWGRVVDPTED